MEIPFFRPAIDDKTIAEVGEVLRSGWLTTGPKTAEFEKKFAEYCDAKHCIMVNSCTAALHLSLAAAGISRGDEVITSVYTFAATAEVIEYFDAVPVFVDIRPDTMNIDETLIESKITSKTKAIIPVHFAGHPCEMDSIIDLAKKYNLKVIEDAAHCTPAFYKGRSVGSIGDATCFSFYANKCITTGEGGCVTIDDAEFADKIRILRLHGLSKDAANRYDKKGSWRYDIVERGYKYNPTDMASVIGLNQLSRADEFHKTRRDIVFLYRKYLGGANDILTLEEKEDCVSSCHIFPVRLKNKSLAERDRIIEILKEKGISVSVHYIPLHMHSYYRGKYNYAPENFPEARKASESLITLPVYPGLKNSEIEYICNSVLQTL